MGLVSAIPAKFKASSIFEHMNNPKHFSKFTRYSDTKLLVAMSVQSLAQRTDASRVLVNNLDPGSTSTGLMTDLPWYFKPVKWGMSFLARTPDVGAHIVANAVGRAGKESHGRLISDYELEEYVPDSIGSPR